MKKGGKYDLWLAGAAERRSMLINRMGWGDLRGSRCLWVEVFYIGRWPALDQWKFPSYVYAVVSEARLKEVFLSPIEDRPSRTWMDELSKGAEVDLDPFLYSEVIAKVFVSAAGYGWEEGTVWFSKDSLDTAKGRRHIHSSGHAAKVVWEKGAVFFHGCMDWKDAWPVTASNVTQITPESVYAWLEGYRVKPRRRGIKTR